MSLPKPLPITLCIQYVNMYDIIIQNSWFNLIKIFLLLQKHTYFSINNSFKKYIVQRRNALYKSSKYAIFYDNKIIIQWKKHSSLTQRFHSNHISFSDISQKKKGKKKSSILNGLIERFLPTKAINSMGKKQWDSIMCQERAHPKIQIYDAIYDFSHLELDALIK